MSYQRCCSNKKGALPIFHHTEIHLEHKKELMFSLINGLGFLNFISVPA